MDSSSIKPVHLAIITVVIIGIAASLTWIGFVQPTTSEEENNGISQSWEVNYLGMMNSQTPENERQAHLAAFIAHNAGVGDACEIMHFHSYTCGACQHLQPWLEEFREQYPEVSFTSYEVHESAYQTRLETARREYGEAAPYVPVIFICGSVIEGVEIIETYFEPMVLAVHDLPARSMPPHQHD
jgi:thiol-disulfide isomerase/thioredoxin